MREVIGTLERALVPLVESGIVCRGRASGQVMVQYVGDPAADDLLTGIRGRLRGHVK